MIGSQKHQDPRYLPYVFTGHGAVMGANVLKSERAVAMTALPSGAVRIKKSRRSPSVLAGTCKS